jgi:hypothetical protein
MVNTSYVANASVKITSIRISFTEYISYRDEFFALDLYLGPWMGSTQYLKTKPGHHILEYFDENEGVFIVELAGYDDGANNKLPLRELCFEAELKTKSDVLISQFEIKFFQLPLNEPTDRVIRIYTDLKQELAQITIAAELNGYEVHHNDADLPRFDHRSVLDSFGGVMKSNSYRLCCEPHHSIDWSNDICISRGKVGISSEGKIYGGIGGNYDKVLESPESFALEIVSVFVGSFIVDNGSLHVAKSKSFRKKFVDEVGNSTRKTTYSMKITVEACFGAPSSLVIVDGDTGELLFIQNPRERPGSYGEKTYSREFRVYKYEITGIEHGTVVDVVMQSNVIKKRVVNKGLDSIKARLSGKAAESTKLTSSDEHAGEALRPAFISMSRPDLYAAAEVRYLAAEIIKSVERIKASAEHVIRPTIKPVRPPIPLNSIPLRNQSCKLQLQSRPGSPSAKSYRDLEALTSTKGVDPSPGYLASPDRCSEVKEIPTTTLKCKPWRPPKPVKEGDDTWDMRQLQAFRLFHKHCALFIHSTYGYECCAEYMMRVQEMACRECREANPLLDRSIEQEVEAAAVILEQLNFATFKNRKNGDFRALDQNLVHQDAQDVDDDSAMHKVDFCKQQEASLEDGERNNQVPSSSSQPPVIFPVYCLKNSCARQHMYVYRSQQYLQRLTHGLVGDNAGWILRTGKRGFNWRRWNEREKGYERKKAALEFEHKKSVYDQKWVEKWVCPDCGGEMPYNEDDELRRDLARLKRLSVMFGDLDSFSDEEDENNGINFTTMKVSKDVWCLKCRERYEPKHKWRRHEWENRMRDHEKVRNSRLMTIKEGLELVEEKNRRKHMPQVSGWWRRRCREKELAEMRASNLNVPVKLRRPLLEFAFSGSPFKFSDTNNLGGTLWQRLAMLKSSHDVQKALVEANVVSSMTRATRTAEKVSGTSESDGGFNGSSVAPRNLAAADVLRSHRSADKELDGIGEGFCIDFSQATKVSTRMDWSISKSNTQLRFMLDAGCLGLTDVHRNKHAIGSEAGGPLPRSGYCRAVVSVGARSALLDDAGSSALLEDHFSDSQGRSLTEEYSQLIRQEGSFEEENILRAYALTAGFDTIPLLIEVILLLPIDNDLSERGNFSVGMSFNSFGCTVEQEQEHAVCMFGKDMFSWGICEELSANHHLRAFPSLKFDNVRSSTNLNFLNNGSSTSRYGDDYSDVGLTFAVYERGRKLYNIPPLLPGDKIRILLDPCTGRLTISVLSLPPTQQTETAPPTARSGHSQAYYHNNVLVDPAQLYEDTFIGRHHTFRVPVGLLDSYDIGCTLNANQNICLLPSIHQERKSTSFPGDALIAENLTIRATAPLAASHTVHRVDIGTTGTVAKDKAGTDTEDTTTSLAPIKIARSTISTRNALSKGASMKMDFAKLSAPSVPSIYTSDGQQIDEKRLVELTSVSAPSAKLEAHVAPPTKHTTVELPTLSKFVARRRNALTTLEIPALSYPGLIDRSDSDCNWAIGVPGVVPEGAFMDGGLVSLEMDERMNPVEEGDSTGGVFLKDENREVFIVRIAYVPPSKPRTHTTGSKLAENDETTEKLLKGLSKWALGYCVRGSGRQAQAMWISKNNGELNKVKLICTNHNISSGRVQYLLDSSLSLYRWRKGVIYTTEGTEPKSNNKIKNKKLKASPEEYFSIPRQAVQAVHEIIGDWEIIQYAVRTMIEGCIWPGVYYKHVYHNSQDAGLPSARDWETGKEQLTNVDIKRLHPSQVATKLPPAFEDVSDAVDVRDTQQESLHVPESVVSEYAVHADAEKEVVTSPKSVHKRRTKSRKGKVMTEEETAWTLARDFILTEASRQSSYENAIFAFMGHIKEIHVTEVEFLCHL